MFIAQLIVLLLRFPLLPASVQRHDNDTGEIASSNATSPSVKPQVARLVESRAGGDALEAWDDRPLLFVGVCSHANDATRRHEIRNTYWHDPTLAGGLVEARFVVGQPTSGSAVEEQLQEEVIAHPQDFLRLAVPDGDDRYGAPQNRTAKTVALLAWFSRYSRARYLLKLEDDALPHFAAIVPRLLAESNPLVQLGAPVPCRERLTADAVALDHSYYPRYMDGGGYILSADLARRLDASRAFELRRRLSLEDATVGLWLELDGQAYPDFDVRLEEINVTLGGCSAGDLVSTRNPPGHIACSWQRMMRGDADVCCPAFAAPDAPPSLLQTARRVSASVRRAGRHGDLRLRRRAAPVDEVNATIPQEIGAEHGSDGNCYPSSLRH